MHKICVALNKEKGNYFVSEEFIDFHLEFADICNRQKSR